MRLIIDRIEENVIVAELPNMKTVNLPLAVASSPSLICIDTLFLKN